MSARILPKHLLYIITPVAFEQPGQNVTIRYRVHHSRKLRKCVIVLPRHRFCQYDNFDDLTRRIWFILVVTNLTDRAKRKLSALFELRSMLREMEHELGLHTLTQVEKDVFLAAHALSGASGKVVSSDEIRNHDLTSGIAQASYHRALRSLVSMGLLKKAEGYKSTRYLVRDDLADG